MIFMIIIQFFELLGRFSPTSSIQSSIKGGDIQTPMPYLITSPLLLLPVIHLIQSLSVTLVHLPVMICLYLCHSQLDSHNLIEGRQSARADLLAIGSSTSDAITLRSWKARRTGWSMLRASCTLVSPVPAVLIYLLKAHTAR